MPKISIVIVNFNTKELTLQCIKSILDSRPKSNYEIIVVDNGSDDDSANVISHLTSHISHLKLIINNDNLGFAKANNQGIRIAKGKYILLLNSDTKVKKDAVDNLVEFAKDTSDAGVIGARLLNSDGSIQSSCFNFPTIFRTMKQYWFKQGHPLDKFSQTNNLPTTVDAAVGAALLITPEAIKRVGLLDERYFMFYEDLDYCRKVWKSGLKVYYLPSSEVVHYHGASGSKLTDTQNQWRRLIPSSKIYHGLVKHYLINFIIWTSQKWQRSVS